MLVVYSKPPNKKNGSSIDILGIDTTLSDELVIVGDTLFDSITNTLVRHSLISD